MSSLPRSREEHLVRALPTLQKHWGLLSAEIQGLLNYRQDQAVISYEVIGDLALAGLEGGACERAPRNRGQATSVLPIADLTFGGMSAWVGLQEVWSKRRGNAYLFNYAGMTVHLGRRGSTEKFQAFRAEWSGPTDFNQGIPQFQSPRAGHPHWQVDLLETVFGAGAQPTEEADELRASLRGEYLIRDFALDAPLTDEEIVQRYPISRFHFASAARWWVKDAEHANAPSDEASVRRWIVRSLAYIQSELHKI